MEQKFEQLTLKYFYLPIIVSSKSEGKFYTLCFIPEIMGGHLSRRIERIVQDKMKKTVISSWNLIAEIRLL